MCKDKVLDGCPFQLMVIKNKACNQEQTNKSNDCLKIGR